MCKKEMDKKNRWGVKKVTDMVHEKFHELASENLNSEQIEKWNTESGARGFVAHNAPDDTWEIIVGFKPDPIFYSQITIGLAVDPDEEPEIFTKALVCREKSHEFVYFIWP